MYTHGTPFRRAIEEGLLDPKRTVQIGIRGALYGDSDNDWATMMFEILCPLADAIATRRGG